jgi:hypothetical protein
MSLRNTLLREVSGSIARIVLGFWTGDPSLPADAGADLTSLLGSKTENLLAQRRGARQFAEIGERIAEFAEPWQEDLILDYASLCTTYPRTTHP